MLTYTSETAAPRLARRARAGGKGRCVCVSIYLYLYIHTFSIYLSVYLSPIYPIIYLSTQTHEIYRLTRWRHGQHPGLRRVVLLRRAGGVEVAARRSQPHSTPTPTPNTPSCGCEEEEVTGGGGGGCGCWCGYWCGFRNSELSEKSSLRSKSLFLRAWDVAELKHALAAA